MKMDKVLLTTLENHPKGYGLTSDLLYETDAYGLKFEEIDKMVNFQEFTYEEEFTPNGDIYRFRADDCPPCDIPMGTLRVWAVLRPVIDLGGGI